MNPLDLNAIAAIRDAVNAVDPDDGNLLFDMIEGETDAMELLDEMLEAEATCHAYASANNDRMKQLAERTARFYAKSDALRAGMRKLLEATGLRKIERPAATVSIRAVPPKVLGEDITNLPEDCVAMKYSPDRKAIKARLDAGEAIEGWSLSNGGETISIRRA